MFYQPLVTTPLLYLGLARGLGAALLAGGRGAVGAALPLAGVGLAGTLFPLTGPGAGPRPIGPGLLGP